MNRTSLLPGLLPGATLLGLLVSGLIAWQLGGTRTAGTLCGFLLGAAVSTWGVYHLRHVARTRPQGVFAAFALAMGLKLFALVVGVLVLFLIEPLAARVDPAAFLLAYAGAAVLVLLFGTTEAMRLLESRPTIPPDRAEESTSAANTQKRFEVSA